MKKVQCVVMCIISTCLAVAWTFGKPLNSDTQTDTGFQARSGMPQSYGGALAESRKKFNEYAQLFSSKLVLQEMQNRIEVAGVIKTRVLKAIEQTKQNNTARAYKGFFNDELMSKHALCMHNESTLVVPAERLFKRYVGRFVIPLDFSDLPVDVAAVIQQFYELQLKAYMEEITNNIKKDPTINPDNLELYEYGIVIPALAHCSVSEDITLQFIRHIKDTNLGIYLGEFCLRRLNCPGLALKIAKHVFEAEQTESSVVIDWAIKVSQHCVEDYRPDLVEKLLRTVIDNLNDKDKIVELRLKIAESFSKCGDNVGATKECTQIVSDFPNSSLYGKVMSVYFAYLAKQSKPERIVQEIESALEMPQCQKYLLQLMYLKWHALRKTNRQTLANQIGEQLIKHYGDNPYIAPVLLSHAIDALSNMHYDRCQELLRQLIRNFPQTNSAEQAQEILDRLGSK